MKKNRIGDLPENPVGAAVYYRANEEIWFRLNESFHVRVIPGNENGSWIGDGKAEKINPNEEVRVIHPAAC